MSSGKTAEDPSWKVKEGVEEAKYVRQKEQAQLDALRHELKDKESQAPSEGVHPEAIDRDFEGGFGGQEDLEDRYATTSGEH